MNSAVNDKINNFSHFQHVISDSLPPPPHPATASVIMMHCVRKYVTHLLPRTRIYPVRCSKNMGARTRKYKRLVAY